MTDNRRSLSPQTRVFSERQDILRFDQIDRIPSLINSEARLDTMSDEEIARQHQEDLFTVESMDISEPFEHAAAPFNPPHHVDIDADEAYALQLQEEEYSRRSLNPSRTYKTSTATKKIAPISNNTNATTTSRILFDTNIAQTFSDEQLAAHLQAQEEHRGRRHQQRPAYATQRPIFPPQRPSNPTFPAEEPEIIPLQRPTVRRPSRNNNNNNDNPNNFNNLFQLFAANSANRGGIRRNRDVQNTTDDFGPNDYERLLELDNHVHCNKLTTEQINVLPTERFQGARSNNDEENRCSVCWDDFEQNQILRRLRCFHLYHKDCIDKWLKDKNQCPICRVPPIV